MGTCVVFTPNCNLLRFFSANAAFCAILVSYVLRYVSAFDFHFVDNAARKINIKNNGR